MRKTKAVRLHRGRWLAIIGDSRDYLLQYSVVDMEMVGTPDEPERTQVGSLTVRVSRTLIVTLRLDANDPEDMDMLEKIVFGHVRQYFKDRIYRGEGIEAELKLTTYNPPRESHPDRIEVLWDTPMVFPVAQRPMGFAPR